MAAMRGLIAAVILVISVTPVVDAFELISFPVYTSFFIGGNMTLTWLFDLQNDTILSTWYGMVWFDNVTSYVPVVVNGIPQSEYVGRASIDSDNRTLRIRDLRPSDEGSYEVHIETPSGNVVYGVLVDLHNKTDLNMQVFLDGPPVTRNTVILKDMGWYPVTAIITPLGLQADMTITDNYGGGGTVQCDGAGNCTGISIRCNNPYDTIYVDVTLNVVECDVNLQVSFTIMVGTDTVPIVEDVSPTYGPVAGGTAITARGQYFERFPVEGILLEVELECTLMESSTNVIIATTPSATEDLVEKKLNIAIAFANGGMLIPTKEYFTYRSNPIIEDIIPTEMPVDGGTTVTITGQSLNSVAKPQLKVTMVHRRRWKTDDGSPQSNITKTEFHETCRINSSIRIFCTTPALDIPNEFLETISGDSGNVSRIARLRRGIEHTSRGRGQVNYVTDNADLSFYMGFVMDGDTTYNNISETPGLEHLGTFTVFGKFIIDALGTVMFRPDIDETLDITGIDMDRGCTKDDYVINIGAGECALIDLSSNAATCQPPHEEPEAGDSFSHEGLAVVVHIGSKYTHDVGYLRYMHTPKSMTSIIAGSVAGGIVLIGIAAVAAVFYWRRGRRSPRGADNETSPPNDGYLAPTMASHVSDSHKENQAMDKAGTGTELSLVTGCTNDVSLTLVNDNAGPSGQPLPPPERVAPELLPAQDDGYLSPRETSDNQK